MHTGILLCTLVLTILLYITTSTRKSLSSMHVVRLIQGKLTRFQSQGSKHLPRLQYGIYGIHVIICFCLKCFMYAWIIKYDSFCVKKDVHISPSYDVEACANLLRRWPQIWELWLCHFFLAWMDSNAGVSHLFRAGEGDHGKRYPPAQNSLRMRVVSNNLVPCK